MFISTRICSSKLLKQYQHDKRIHDIKYKQNDNKPLFLIDNVKDESYYNTFVENCQVFYETKIKQKAQLKTCWALDGVITFSKNFKDSEQSDTAAIEFLENLAKKHNVKVLYLVKHTDETTPHYHFQISTQNIETGKSIRKNFNNRQYLSELQTSVYETFKNHNVDVIRGISKEKRIKDSGELANVKHLNISESHYIASRQICNYINKKSKIVNEQIEEVNKQTELNSNNKRKLINYKNKIDKENEILKKQTGELYIKNNVLKQKLELLEKKLKNTTNLKQKQHFSAQIVKLKH